MKKLFSVLLFLFVIYLIPQTFAQTYYEIDVTNYQDDLFHVVVIPEELKVVNNIYNFPTTVPGTYSIQDFGRFVKSFKAVDKNGVEIPVEKISTNRWRISSVDDLHKIIYDVEDTFDAGLSENVIYPMEGTGIENDLILLNTFGVLGYFEGMQSEPIKLKIDYSSDWTIGTAMNLDNDGYYTAETYDRLADSPVLIGKLTTANIKVDNINVEVYVYSPDTAYTAKKILSLVDETLQSAGNYIGFSPVPRYDFLICFLSGETYQRNKLVSSGALEHSYSSLYVFPLVGNMDNNELRNTMAHEFMHILTPLNLHSEIIEPFNFEVPTASEHIWLYEGVTEWSSDIMQLRSGLITYEEYFSRISEKLRVNDRFDQNISLVKMSKEVYSEEILNEFLNFYNRGAVTAALLDIRLLELSKGTRGLREVFLELLQRYGKHNPFPENKLFDIIVSMTYPEIEQFINDYIKGSKPLPYVEYMNMIGFKYIYEKESDDMRPTLGIAIGMSEEGMLKVISFRQEHKNSGLQEGDLIVKFQGKEINMQNVREVLSEVYSMKIGDHCKIIVKRDGEEKEIMLTLLRRKIKHAFEEIESPTPEQKFLRDAWSRNL